MAKLLKYGSPEEELLALNGTFDLSGVTKLDTKQFTGFKASDGAIISEIKGVKVGYTFANLAAIRTAEVDISALLVTSLAKGLDGSSIYRAKGYIITSVTLGDTTSLLHMFYTKNQVSS